MKLFKNPGTDFQNSCGKFCLVLVFQMASTGFAQTPFPFLQRLPVEGDRIEELDSGPLFEKNFYRLLENQGSQGRLQTISWANGSWPLDHGLIAYRYADPNFQKLKNWQDRKRYIERNSALDIKQEGNSRRREILLDQLSPAEKYDWLVGDEEFTLTRSQWQAGENFWNRGQLASWMGICEGTAAAGVQSPEPQRSVVFKTSGGETLRFHPLDVKALVGLLWSAYTVKTPVLGHRCDGASASRNSREEISPGCRDNNPSTWHIALTNLIGERKQNLFINRSLDGEVWNVPVLSYQLHFFNPRTRQRVNREEEAVMARRDWPEDPWQSSRSPNSDFIVEVESQITLAMGVTTQRALSENSKLVSVIYRYQLELDGSGEIIGGEWVSTLHPDFLWTLEKNYVPNSLGDRDLEGQSWNGEFIPETWLPSVQKSSRFQQPLRLIVQKLLFWSAHTTVDSGER